MQNYFGKALFSRHGQRKKKNIGLHFYCNLLNRKLWRRFDFMNWFSQKKSVSNTIRMEWIKNSRAVSKHKLECMTYTFWQLWWTKMAYTHLKCRHCIEYSIIEPNGQNSIKSISFWLLGHSIPIDYLAHSKLDGNLYLYWYWYCAIFHILKKNSTLSTESTCSMLLYPLTCFFSPHPLEHWDLFSFFLSLVVCVLNKIIKFS